MMSKTCAGCGENLPLTEYFFRDKARSRPQAHCKGCTNAYKRQWYRANREHHMEISQAAKGRRIAVNVARIRAYLIAHPCVDCGEADPIVLEFDHVRGTKIGNASQMVRDRPWSAIVSELAKCDVRCANCHRRRTARDYGWYAYLLPL